MGELNLSSHEREALEAIDAQTIDALIEQCLRDGFATELHRARLGNCGLYVAQHLSRYEKALSDYRAAKSSKKRADTQNDARRAGAGLSHAVAQMKARVKVEEEEGQRFFVEDQIFPPSRLQKAMTVTVNFRWRANAEESWQYGRIEFSHDFSEPPLFHAIHAPRRRPSAAQQAREQQEQLFREWEHLKRLALLAVRDFFRMGGDGATIPTHFRSSRDAYSGGLNNFSLDFWRGN